MIKDALKYFSLAFIAWLSALQSVQAQAGVDFFSTKPEVFIEEFGNAFTSSKSETAGAVIAEFKELWSSDAVSEAEKEQFITQVNIMVSRRFFTSPDLENMAWIVNRLKRDDTYATLDFEDFLEANMQIITQIEQKRASKYLQNLRNYLPEGVAVQRRQFSWSISQPDPELKLLSIEDKNGEKYQAPVLHFDGTNLSFRSDNDSSLIEGTTGDYNLVAETFTGEKGRVSWAKVGLPEDDVFCDFHAYKVNFNYGLIKVDTVDFQYRSLFSGSLRGKFEDANKGYSNRNAANYPYFKSYDGGIVIENFLPGVRYEGGFSLKGVRKIGTSYNVWKEYEKEETDAESEGGYYGSYSWSSASSYSDDEAKDDEWDYGEWEDYSSSESSFATEDTGYYDDYEGYDYEDYDESDYDYGEVDESGGFGFETRYQEHVKAKLEISRGEQKVLKLKGEAVVLDLMRMIGKRMETIVLTPGGDSIYHPEMDLIYTVEDTTLILKKPRSGSFSAVPFASSYHQFFLYFESIAWNLNTDLIRFTAYIDKENKVSAVESFDFFDRQRFNQTRGLLSFNPLGAIYRYAALNPDQPIFVESILEEYNLMEQKEGFRATLPNLEASGYLTYDRRSYEVTPLPKLYDWARAARKVKDYDRIQIISKVDSGDHAMLNVQDMTLHMQGITFFDLSDSSYVRVVPQDGEVAVGKNRTLKFGGAMAAGRINLYASATRKEAFTFDYDSYRILCDSIDSLRFVLVRTKEPGLELTPLQKALQNTVFEGITGAVHIDDANNKSGVKDYPYFPVFDSYSRSYVYWAKPEIQGGVYEKTKLYFAIDPFVLDSLETFDENGLTFDGEFFSSEIFPAFRQTLQVMPDFTLGFTQETPDLGYRIYDNQGKYYETITLDGSGLHGRGKLEVLGTELVSDSIVFHFDSAMAMVTNFDQRRGFRRGVYFPEVQADTGYYTWYTKKGILSLRSASRPVNVFGGQGLFEGNLMITAEGMIGDGALTLGQVRVTGDSIVFHEMDFVAGNSEFAILDDTDPSQILFKANGVDITYDVWRHESAFETKEVGNLLAEFPQHKYATSLAKGSYNRRDNQLKIEGVSSYLRDNRFESTDPQQYGLSFLAQEAIYNVDSMVVVVNGVPNISVADALISPENNTVELLTTGYMQTLQNAVIEADQVTKFHRIYEATVDIFSSHEYEGSGKYDYIEVNDEQQYVAFNDISVNADTTTVAEGFIEEFQGFYLTERIFFRGEAFLDASERFLAFEGEVKIESQNPVFQGAWFNFERTVVNPDSVFIPIAADLTNDLGEQLTAGLLYIPENRAFYSNFLQAKEADGDKVVLNASGGLTFDRKRKEFKIGSEARLKGETFKGTTVSYDEVKNTITSRGYLDLPTNFGEGTISLDVSGTWKDDLNRRDMSTDLIMGINMEVIPKEALEKLTETMVFLTAGNKDIGFTKLEFLQDLSEILDRGRKDDDKTREFLVEANTAMIYSNIHLAEKLPYTLLFSNVNFHYDADYKTLYSDTDVGLIGLGGNDVNKMVGAKIVYRLGGYDAFGEREPDQLTIYLEVDEFNWVYFRYENQVVKTVSSFYDGYNAILKEELDKGKAKEGYRLEMASEDEKARFLQDFVKKYIR